MLFRSDRKSTRLNSSHLVISYAVFCLKKKNRRRDSGAARYPRPSRRSAPGGTAGDAVGVAHPRHRRSFFFFNDTAPTGIYPLSLHDALPISPRSRTASWSLLVVIERGELKPLNDDE